MAGSAVSLLTKAATPRWKWLLTSISLAIAILLLAACGGEGDQGPAQTPTAEGSPITGETPTAGETPSPSPVTTLQPSEELRLFSEAWANKSAKVTYDLSTTTDGATDSGAMTLSWRPPDSRMNISTADEGEVIFIVAGGATYLCSEGECLSLPSPESPLIPPFPFLGSFTHPDALNASILGAIAGVDVEKSLDDIAGQRAGCYSVTSSIEGGTGGAQWCFSFDTILLRFVSSFSGPEGGGEFRLEATEVLRQVSDSDFQPPFPVTEIPVGQ